MIKRRFGRTHGVGCVRQWFRTAEPFGESRYENWNTHTHTHTRARPRDETPVNIEATLNWRYISIVAVYVPKTWGKEKMAA